MSRPDAPLDAWPRSAPVVLVLIALAAAGTVAAVMAGGRPAAATAAIGAGALAGAATAAAVVGYVRHLYRTDRWTSRKLIAIVLGSFLVAGVIGFTAMLATGTLRLVAVAALAGAIGGGAVASLLWRRSVSVRGRAVP